MTCFLIHFNLNTASYSGMEPELYCYLLLLLLTYLSSSSSPIYFWQHWLQKALQKDLLFTALPDFFNVTPHRPSDMYWEPASSIIYCAAFVKKLQGDGK